VTFESLGTFNLRSSLRVTDQVTHTQSNPDGVRMFLHDVANFYHFETVLCLEEPHVSYLQTVFCFQNEASSFTSLC